MYKRHLVKNFQKKCVTDVYVFSGGVDVAQFQLIREIDSKTEDFFFFGAINQSINLY